ncbi:MAG: acyl-CoA dehydrogenase [Zoogloeaceae bacterium]|jgi:alkylation response protein AidB-like acyl-CoA dehydrogenase|nr:acyl-CoA dehydrogenase [Zoogloeaceae bacterium]
MDRVSRYTPPLEDLRFLLGQVLDVSRLFNYDAYAHADQDLAEAVLTGAARYASEALAPLNAIGDEQGSRLENGRVRTPQGFPAVYRALADGGWIGLDMPAEHGGQALPLVLQAAYAEMINGACVSFGMLPLMQRAAARLLIAHAGEELAAAFAPRLVAGDWGATICISEPQAGSDVGRISTRAAQDAKGVWRVTGSKIFITYGDQDFTPQILHLLLARTPDAPPGTRGLSLFVVPARVLDANGEPGAANGVSVARVEHKMGLKASPTCVMDFDNALAYPVGAAGAGMRCMFTMVNTMRLEVAMQGVAIAGAATARAMEYAAERCQGGPSGQPAVPLTSHADVVRMLFEMRALTEGFRALTLQAAYCLDVARAADDEKARAEALALAEWLLPVCKAGGSEAGFRVANLAVQIFGGHGYVCDSGVEQYVRDARVMAIYEGANGIQALDLVTRKLGADAALRYRLFAAAVGKDLAAAAADNPLAAALKDALADLESASDWMLEQLRAAPRNAEAGATAYLQLAGLVGVGWMWLRMSAAAGTQLADAKRATARFYGEHLLSETGSLLRRIQAGSATLDSLTPGELCRYPG